MYASDRRVDKTGNKTTLENKNNFSESAGPKSIKYVYVRNRSDNRYYYPKTIPREREPLATYITLTAIFLLFAVDVYIAEDGWKNVVGQYAAAILMYIMLHLLYRSFLICEEMKHLRSRYENSYLRMFKDAFYLSPEVIIAAMICIILLITSAGELRFNGIMFPRCMLLITAVYLIGEVLKMRSCPLEESLWVAKNNGLDYGSGMAYSFFHGYLNLVLPKTGTESKNLKELMQDYEDSHGITFAIYKLFILIPTSLRCFTSLMNEYSKSIEESTSLPEKLITVAGVLNRVYKNAVYKINSGKSKIYVSAEYATPLKTFNEVFKAAGQHSGYYEKFKEDIILQFYLTLKAVLEKNHLNESCELIYYEDTYQSEGVVQYYDVGQIILNRVKELKKLKLDKSE